jgi:hypothetical protein
MRKRLKSRANRESGRGHRASSSWQLLFESNPVFGFVEEYTAAPAWIAEARHFQESFRFAPGENASVHLRRLMPGISDHAMLEPKLERRSFRENGKRLTPAAPGA